MILSPTKADELPMQIIVVSDLHMGFGKTEEGNWHPTEDFRWHAAFDEFLKHIAQDQDNKRTDLVFAGDVLELWQSDLMQCDDKGKCKVSDCVYDDKDLGCNQADAEKRFDKIIKAHSQTFQSIREFAEHENHTTAIVPGNHDAALLFDNLKSKFTQVMGDQVELSDQGYWMSEDNDVAVSHGHEFDSINLFEEWPEPFVTGEDGTQYLFKPAGESFVQFVFNNYEVAYPVIDNLANEFDGISGIARELGLFGTLKEIISLIKISVQDIGLSRVAIFLGEEEQQCIDPESEECVIEWDLAKLKVDCDASSDTDSTICNNQQFIVETFPKDSGYSIEAFDDQLIPLPSDLDDETLNELCDLRATWANNGIEIESCPTMANDLGAGLDVLGLRRSGARKDFLTELKEETGQTFSSYVYGHTHKAEEYQTLDLEDFSVEYANDGAFQRVISKEQLESLLEHQACKDKELDLAAMMRKLQPEHLPECYSFIRINPEDSLTPDLLYWAPEDNVWSEREECPAFDSQAVCDAL